MKISVTSDNPLQHYYLKDINNTVYSINLNTEQNIPDGWYEFCVEYVDTKTEITDIEINGSSIGYMLYTGYCTTYDGKRHQPACAVWEPGCVFSIWINTQIGQMYSRIYEAIRNGDFGKNLFDKYLLTVDRPIDIKNTWPRNISSFFKTSHGPQWWFNNDQYTPWKYLNLPSIDVDLLLDELDSILPYSNETLNLTIKQLKNKQSDLPFVELEDISSRVVRDFVESAGYKRLIDISVQKLEPGAYVPIHRDDHYQRQAYPYMKGCTKLYWACTNPEDVYFKLGRSGILPIDKPLLINTIEHPHALVHEGSQVRTSILVYGER